MVFFKESTKSLSGAMPVKIYNVVFIKCGFPDNVVCLPYLGTPYINFTRKYLLRGYILGVLTHTTAWDQHWGSDVTLK